MTDNGLQKINLDTIMTRIQNEAAARKAEGPRFARKDRIATGTTKSEVTFFTKKETKVYRFAKAVQRRIRAFPFYALVYNAAFKFKRFIPKYDESIPVEKLLSFHDDEFIRNAFRTIMGREPDPTGFKIHMDKLRSGRLTKAEILGKLRYSQEGKESKTHIKGLLLRYVITRSYRIPIIGYILGFFSALLRLPKILKNIQQYEAFANARLSQHTESLNMLSANLHTLSVETNKRITEETIAINQGMNTLSHDLNTVISAEISGIEQKVSAASHDLNTVIFAEISGIEQKVSAASHDLNTRISAEISGIEQKVSAAAHDLNIKISTEITHMSTEINAVSHGMNERLASEIHNMASVLDDKTKTLYQTSMDMKSMIDGINASKADGHALDQMAHHIQEQKINLIELQHSLRVLLDNIKTKQVASLTPEQVQRLASEEDHILDALYVAFEDKFRGKTEDIRERIKVYLPLMQKAGAGTAGSVILDIGCGRGEWLELLKENNYSAKGVDLNRTMTRECRERGLDAIDEDVIEFLKQQKSGSFNAITGLHIVEHLPLKTLVLLLDECFRTLKSGGVVLFETPNPENVLVGATFFHIDPTHGNPLHPLTMEFLLEQRGFQDIEIRRLHPIPVKYIDNEMVQNLLFGPQDYASIGYKK